MGVTEEATTLPPEMQRWVKLARIAVGLVVGAVVTIVSAMATYRMAAGDAQARAQSAKQLAEDGYQVARPVVDDHDKRIAELERIVRQLAQQQHPPARRGSKPRAPAAILPPAAPKTLPRNLDEAQRQVAKAGAPAPAPDGGPRKGE